MCGGSLSDTALMFVCLFQMKTPPDRSGIIFEVGAQLEARDRHKTWSGSHTRTHACAHTHTQNNVNNVEQSDISVVTRQDFQLMLMIC